MTIHSIDKSKDLVAAAKVDLAAAHRLAVYHELEEGIDNHFTMTVPGTIDQYLVLPFGMHWSEARASDLISFNEAGDTLEGQGLVELSAQCIHAPIHRITGKSVVLHTHQNWALALNMLEDNRLIPACQTSAFFDGQVVYYDEYHGTADTLEEGERLAAALGDKEIMFLRNHGLLVASDTISKAYRMLYNLERVCRAQLRAMATGKALLAISPEVIKQVQTPDEHDRHKGQRHNLFFDAMKRIMDREMPGYAD
ncbi:MAG: ribulose-5-phosphate 4-epimerase/fuculose-1-phosphate aldolase [Gammaproteobacteria bacterium]|jgi:ribulose-5-phosphate 4-epimerase/fuculose-1-phosphate aldolase